ncbi:bis(5'-nucleosyl)-tetraphosphatase (symmetrical) YqeK [Pseudothermotoga sp.]
MRHVVEELVRALNLLVTTRRRRHVYSCCDFARKLARLHHVDEEKVTVACLAHDAFRDVPTSKLLRIAKAYGIEPKGMELEHPVLLHGKVAAEYLRRRFKIEDRDILEAVAFHTSGKPNMGEIAKIVFLADSLEETRAYEGVEDLRRLAERDLDEAVIQTLRSKVCYAMKKEYLLFSETVEMWNWLLRNKRSKSLIQNDQDGVEGG